MELTEKQTTVRGWRCHGRHQPHAPLATAWTHDGGLIVLSECSDMKLDGTDPVITTAQWLVFVSTRHARRPSNSEMLFVRKSFDVRDAEEDNHEPGVARKLFMICDPGLREQHTTSGK